MLSPTEQRRLRADAMFDQQVAWMMDEARGDMEGFGRVYEQISALNSGRAVEMTPGDARWFKIVACLGCSYLGGKLLGREI